MDLAFHGDKTHTMTVIQKGEDGETQVLFLLTPELIERIKNLEDRIEKLQGRS